MFVCCLHCLIVHSLWLRRTPLVAWPPCRPGHQSVMICSVRLCSKLCRPPTSPLCRWANLFLKGIIASRRGKTPDESLCLLLACGFRADGSPRCSSSGTWASKMRSWCWGRCRPQTETSRPPWSSFLLVAPDFETEPPQTKLSGEDTMQLSSGLNEFKQLSVFYY